MTLETAHWPLTPEQKRAAVLEGRSVALRDLADDASLPISDVDRAALRRVAMRLRVTAAILLRRAESRRTP